MKAREYVVLARAVEEGVASGYRHAFKHTDAPTPEYIQSEMEQAVVLAICEVFDFDVDPEPPYAPPEEA